MPSDDLKPNENPEERIIANIVCNQKAGGMIQFAMNGELKDLTFMYYSIGLHINKIISEQQEKFRLNQATLPSLPQ